MAERTLALRATLPGGEIFLASMFVVRLFPSYTCRKRMPTAQDIVNSLIRKAPAFFRYAFILQTVVGMFLCGLGYFMGGMHLRLILEGAKTQGTIVDYQQRSFSITRTNYSFTFAGYTPVVEYRADGDKKIRFEDWLGKSSRSMLNQSVPVLYDTADPSIAMIDRPVWNWMPWAPILAVGLLLVLDGIRRGMRLAFQTI